MSERCGHFLIAYLFRHDGGQSAVLLPEAEEHRLAREAHEVADAPQLSLLGAVSLRQASGRCRNGRGWEGCTSFTACMHHLGKTLSWPRLLPLWIKPRGCGKARKYNKGVATPARGALTQQCEARTARVCCHSGGRSSRSFETIGRSV